MKDEDYISEAELHDDAVYDVDATDGTLISEGEFPIPDGTGKIRIPRLVLEIEPLDFLQQVRIEVERARRKHPTNIHNVAEGYAVILEELDEYWDEVKTQTSRRVKDDLLKELVQVAAMCMRTAEDCDLV